MFGREELVIRPERRALGRLNEAARPFGELLHIHDLAPFRPLFRP